MIFNCWLINLLILNLFSYVLFSLFYQFLISHLTYSILLKNFHLLQKYFLFKTKVHIFLLLIHYSLLFYPKNFFNFFILHFYFLLYLHSYLLIPFYQLASFLYFIILIFCFFTIFTQWAATFWFCLYLSDFNLINHLISNEYHFNPHTLILIYYFLWNSLSNLFILFFSINFTFQYLILNLYLLRTPFQYHLILIHSIYPIY